MTRHQSDVQDTFLNLLRKEGVPVTVYLLGGVSLRGTVRGFDAFTIEVDTPGRPVQAVYKRSVASVVPQRPLRGLSAGHGGRPLAEAVPRFDERRTGEESASH